MRHVCATRERLRHQRRRDESVAVAAICNGRNEEAVSLKNPTYNELAQMAHFFGAGFIILASGGFGQHLHWYLSAALVFYALLKEFWYDLRYERPEVSGGVKGGIVDLLFYVLGVLVANLILCVKL